MAAHSFWRALVQCDRAQLGVVIMGDGGDLFALACGVWISGWIILALSLHEVLVAGFRFCRLS